MNDELNLMIGIVLLLIGEVIFYKLSQKFDKWYLKKAKQSFQNEL